MNGKLEEKCKLFVENRDIIKSAFKWDGDAIALAGSSLFTGLDITANKEKLKNCEEILKKHFGALSEFRGNAKIPLICQMSTMDDPERYLIHTKDIYEKMNNNSVIGSDSKLISALTIASHTLSKNPENYINKTDNAYNQMKENHRWLTSTKDLPYAAMFAVSDMEIDPLFAESEKCFELLKGKFEKNAAQSLSHVLALCDGTAEQKCNKVMAIFDGLKNAKHKFGADYELASLGTICSLDIDNEQIIKEICEVDDYLKKQKGFGSFSISSYTRLMYATLIVMNYHNKEMNTVQNTIINNVLSMTLSMELCMIIILFS